MPSIFEREWMPQGSWPHVPPKSVEKSVRKGHRGGYVFRSAMPQLASVDDPRSIAHWWARHPEVPLVVDTSHADRVAPPLHLSLSKLAAKRSGERARAPKSYVSGVAHPMPLPCTSIGWNGRRVVLANANCLAPRPVERCRKRDDRWHALARASAILWVVDPAKENGRSLVRSAADLGVSRAIIWSPREASELAAAAVKAAGMRDVSVVVDTGANAGTELLDALSGLPPRKLEPDAPFELCVARSPAYGLECALAAYGVVTSGNAAVGLHVHVGADGRVIDGVIREVRDGSTGIAGVVVDTTVREVRAQWVVARNVSAARREVLSSIARS